MKTKIKKSVAVSLVMAILLCTFSSCSLFSPERSFIGEWYNEDKSDCLKILKDNTYFILHTEYDEYGTKNISTIDQGDWYLSKEEDSEIYFMSDRIKIVSCLLYGHGNNGYYINHEIYGKFYKDRS